LHDGRPLVERLFAPNGSQTTGGILLGHRELRWKGDKLMIGTRNSGAKIIPDSTWPGMFRAEYPPGVVSDMTNLTRAKDAAIGLVTYRLNSKTPENKTPEKAVREPARFANPPAMGPDSPQVQITQPSTMAA